MGPDASRYILAGAGHRVAKPFHLRFLLPLVCRDHLSRWRAVWLGSWVVAAFGLSWWAYESGMGWQRCAAVAVLCLGLQGVWGPHVIRPVGVDLPALALSSVAVAALEAGWWPLAVVLILVAAGVKEQSPVWAALWAWHPLLLVGLIVPAVVQVVRPPVMDPVTAQGVLRHVHDHPVQSAREHQMRRHMWRSGWVLVFPWGVCLVGLYRPSVQLVAVLVLAYAQLLVATDTVRLVHYAAGPVLAMAAAQVLPVEWLLIACVVHVVWWRNPELQ